MRFCTSRRLSCAHRVLWRTAEGCADSSGSGRLLTGRQPQPWDCRKAMSESVAAAGSGPCRRVRGRRERIVEWSPSMPEAEDFDA